MSDRYNPETWSAVESFLSQRLAPGEDPFQIVLDRAKAAELPQIQVSFNDGKLLSFLVEMTASRKVLEIGTLAGYSSLWMASTLPEDGKLWTLELDPAHAQLASQNFTAFSPGTKIHLIEGPALESLPKLEAHAPFDFIFIDADKPNNAAYLAWALRLSRPGTTIVLDNIVRDGKIIKPELEDPAAEGVRQGLDYIRGQRRFDATWVQTVGSKGYDGWAILRVTD